MGVSQLSDFIDHASIQAEAAAYGELMHDRAERRAYHAFMAGAAAYAALLDAETTEEWGVRHISVDGWPSDLAHTSKEAAERDLETCGWNCHLISRRVAVTPWLPSEGGGR